MLFDKRKYFVNQHKLTVMRAQKLPILFFIGKLREGIIRTEPIDLDLFTSPSRVYIKLPQGGKIIQYSPEPKTPELTTRFLLTSTLKDKKANLKDTDNFFGELTTTQFMNVLPANLPNILSLTDEMKIAELLLPEKYIRLADSVDLNNKKYQLLVKREFSRPWFSLIFIPFNQFMELNACPFLVKYNS